MGAKIDAKVVLKTRRLNEKVAKAYAKELRKHFAKRLPAAQKRLRKILNFDLQGVLAITPFELGELGEPQFKNVMRDLIKIWVDSVHIVQDKPITGGPTGRVTGRFRIQAINADFSDVLNHPGASFVSEGGFKIKWLSWLLTEGRNAKIANYSFRNLTAPPLGRTGQGIMSKSNRGWQLSSRLRGNRNDNIVTRIIESRERVYQAILVNEFRKM